MTKQEAKEALLKGEISYDEFVIILKEMDTKVGKLDAKVDRTHNMVADLYQSLRPSMSALVESNQEAATTLREMRRDQQEQVNIIAGKRQVPYPIFLLVVLLLGLLIVVEKIERSRTTIEVTPNSVKLSPVEGGVNARSIAIPTATPVR